MSSFDATKPRSRVRALLPAVVAAAFASIAGYTIANPPHITATYLDFNAFYCGARILGDGGDPYRYEPLHSCEVANLRPATPNAVVPAPLPPYALAAFLPISRLVYPRAQFAWWLLLIAGGMLILWVLLERTALPLLVVAACVLVGMVLPSLIVGSLALVPIALLCLSAVALLRGRWTAAAVLQGCACIEPHVAAPVLLATFVFVPRMRLRIAYVAAAILIASVFAGGARLNIEYATNVLPAHAVSEINNGEQYGLSALLRAVGLAERTAALIGNAQYLLFVVAGLCLVRGLHRKMPESAVFVPMALAVTGGPFIHVTQIGAAIPLALALAARTRTAVAWAGVTLIAVAIPWQASIGFGGVVAAIVLLVVLLYNRIPWAGAFAAAAVLGTILTRLQLPELFRRQTITLATVAPTALAEIPWRQLADQFPPTAFSWCGHALIYAGFACTYWSLLTMARAHEYGAIG